MIKKTIIRLMALLMCSVASQAQNVKGIIVDEKGEPLENVNVVLASRSDSTFICGTTSGSDGSFAIHNDGNALLRLSYLGYNTKYIDTEGDSLGILQMMPDQKLLAEVEVKGSVPRATMKGSSLVMNVENTILSEMGTVGDVLSQIPTVVKKGDDFEVIGKGTPLIYINGRKVSDKRELTELRSDQIKNIEVIQNPGARYDATVSAVIRIKTKQAVGEGFSVELGSWTKQDKGMSNNEWLNLTYRKNGLEIFAEIFAEPHKESKEKNYYDETVTADTLWDIHNDERSHLSSNYYSGKLGFNYNNNRHSFGAYYENNRYSCNGNGKSQYSLKGNGMDYDQLTNNMHQKDKTWPNHTANIYYNGQISKWMIDFNTDIISRKNSTSMLSVEQGERAEDQRDVTTENTYTTHMIAEKLIAVHALWKGSIGFGEELTAIKRINDFTNKEGLFANDNNETHETTIAPFAELSQTIGKWNLTLGLRYEHSIQNYFVGGTKQAEQCRTYDYLFPSFDASTMWRGLRLAFSYTSKTVRPSFNQLNSSLLYGNCLSYQQGNPLLKPSISHSFQLMTMWKSFFLMANFRRIDDDIQMSVENYQGDEKIQLVTTKNYEHRNVVILTLGTQRTIGAWNLNYSTTMLKQWFKVKHSNGICESYNNPIFVIKLNNAFSLPKGWIARLDYEIMTKGNEELLYAYRVNQRLNFAVSRDFMKGRLHVQIDCSDIFGTNRNAFKFHSNNFAFRRYDNPYTRSASLTLTYRFNTTDSKYRGTGAGNDAKGRL